MVAQSITCFPNQVRSTRVYGLSLLRFLFFISKPNLSYCERSPFNYIWTSDYWGWLNPPVHYCAVVEKLFRDKGRGTVFYPLDSHKFSSLLHNFASIIFTFDLNAVGSSQMAAFIIDSTLTHLPLHLLFRFRSIQTSPPLLNTLLPLSKLMLGYALSIYIQTILSFIELLMELFGEEV